MSSDGAAPGLAVAAGGVLLKSPAVVRSVFGGVACKVASNRNVADDNEKWSRMPKSIQDQMTLRAARDGKGYSIIKNLNDPKFKGMEKMELKVKSANGRDSVVHHVRNPETGELKTLSLKGIVLINSKNNR